MTSPNLGLGRRYASDARDTQYLLRAITPTSRLNSRYWWAGGWWGDQGDKPQCVAYAWLHWLADGPVTQKLQDLDTSASWLYGQCQLVDEWEGIDYDGTSVRAGAKVLQKMRELISEYRWAFDLDTLVDAVLEKGPVVMGTNWYSGMFSPNDNGVVKIAGSIAGGHAWLVNGVNKRTAMFRAKNSWGKEWGKGGHFYVTFEDMERLLTEQGEACLAIEIKGKKL